MNEKLQNRIISVAYGDASFLENYRIKKLASQNNDVKQMLDEYSEIAKSVHSITKEEFVGKPKLNTLGESQKSLIDDIYIILLGKPIITIAVAILMVFAISFSIINNQELSYEGYTIAEVQKADIQTKQALQIVSNIFAKTENKIKNDILTDEVSKPIKEGMSTVNKLFKKEKENES